MEARLTNMISNKSSIHRQQRGAVSLFSVIFAMLLMSVVTISFLRIMVADQEQSSSNDLSQSAYDSSLAGVEDAKRALVWYSKQCKSSSADCVAAAAAINSNQCNQGIRASGVVKAGDVASTAGGAGTGEIKVQQSTSVDSSGGSTDSALDQAYTCVKMQLDTDDYVGVVAADQSIFVPLVADGRFNTVTVEWFSRDDITNTAGTVYPDTSTATPKGLAKKANWPVDRPSLIRAQLMQTGDKFKLTDFDSTDAGKSNANTVFLYPARSGNTSAELTARDVRADTSGKSIPASASSAPLPVSCTTSVSAGGYACKISLQLPEPVGGGNLESAYLRLTSLYVGSHVRVTLQRVTLQDSATAVKFKGVQPVVDSTGRANTVFRRVESRVDLYDNSFPYPDAAVEVKGSFCKDFAVTDTQYIAGSCTP